MPDQAERVWQWCGSHSEERFCGIKPHQGTAKIPQSKHHEDQVESGRGGAGHEGLQDPGHHHGTEGEIREGDRHCHQSQSSLQGRENRGAGEGNPRTEQLQNECLE